MVSINDSAAARVDDEVGDDGVDYYEVYGDHNVQDNDEYNLVREIDSIEIVIEKAKIHVEKQHIQKQQAKHKISLVNYGISNHLSSLLSRQFITIDVEQNISILNFEGEQSGDMF